MTRISHTPRSPEPRFVYDISRYKYEVTVGPYEVWSCPSGNRAHHAYRSLPLFCRPNGPVGHRPIRCASVLMRRLCMDPGLTRDEARSFFMSDEIMAAQMKVYAYLIRHRQDLIGGTTRTHDVVSQRWWNPARIIGGREHNPLLLQLPRQHMVTL